MKFDDEFIFIFSEISTFEIRAKVIDPTKPTAFATTKQSSSLRESSPTAFTMDTNVIDEALIFIFGPSAFVGVGFFTARGSSHNTSNLINNKVIEERELLDWKGLYFILYLDGENQKKLKKFKKK